MKKRISFIIILFITLLFININVRAAFPAYLGNAPDDKDSTAIGFIRPGYCGGSACYCGPATDTNPFVGAEYTLGTINSIKSSNSKYLLGVTSDNTDILAMMCTNHAKTSPLGNVSSCSKITSTGNGYWSDAVKAGVGSIIKNMLATSSHTTPKDFIQNDPEDSNGINNYYAAVKTITRFQADKSVSGVTSVSFGVNDTWLSAANTEYNKVNDMDVSIGTITSTEDDTAFYLTIPVTATGAAENSYTVTTSPSSTLQTNGTYKILKSDLNKGDNEITIDVSSSYTTYIAENYYCGGYQTLTPVYIEQETFDASDTDTITVTVSEPKNLDINIVIDGVVYFSDFPDFGTYDLTVNETVIRNDSSSDHFISYEKDSSYSVSDITADGNHVYLGYNIGCTNTDNGCLGEYGSSKIQSTSTGTIEGSILQDTQVNLIFESKKSFKIIKNTTKTNEIGNPTPVMGETRFSIYNSNSDCENDTNSIGTLTTKNGDGSFLLRKGNYYIKEISAPSAYHVDDTCTQISVTEDGANEITVVNKTHCEYDFEQDNSIEKRLLLYKEHGFRNLLNFNITDSVIACSPYEPSYDSKVSCLTAHMAFGEENRKFDNTNLSDYNDTITGNSDSISYCLTNLALDSIEWFNSPIKAGQLVYGFRNNVDIIVNRITKICYIHENDLSSYPEIDINMLSSVLPSKSVYNYSDGKFYYVEENSLYEISNEKYVLTDENNFYAVSKNKLNSYIRTIDNGKTLYVHRNSGKTNCIEAYNKNNYENYCIDNNDIDLSMNTSEYSLLHWYSGTNNYYYAENSSLILRSTYDHFQGYDFLTYDDYIGSVNLNGQSLGAPSSVNYININVTQRGEFYNIYQEALAYYTLGALPVYVHKISGRPLCNPNIESCTLLGYGIVSEFKDGITGTGSFDFSISSPGTDKKNIFGFDSNNIYACTYNVQPEIIEYVNNDNGNLELEFRSIDTNNPFERDTMSNWSAGDDKSSNNETVETYITDRNNSYNKTGEGALYTNDSDPTKIRIVLTPDLIDQIRTYNQEHPYDNYEISCDDFGNNCGNAFLKEFNIVKK